MFSKKNINSSIKKIVSRDSSVGIATPWRLDGPGIESQFGGGGGRFSTADQTGHEAHPASYTMGTGSGSRGVALTTQKILGQRMRKG
jgi:hypothetical protein